MTAELLQFRFSERGYTRQTEMGELRGPLEESMNGKDGDLIAV